MFANINLIINRQDKIALTGDNTIAQALKIEDLLKALKEILNGNVTDANLAFLKDDWAIEERCKEALTF
ncbi:MAG: hypothetical protein ABIN89_13625 [Chitinophagaceae bacterium]